MRTTNGIRAAILVGASCCVALGGCSGGTLGTGIRGGPAAWSQGQGAAQGAAHVAYFQVEGRVLNQRAKPISGATVTVSTPRSSETMETDAAGKFAAQAVQGAGENLVITVSAEGRSGEYRQSTLPQGSGALVLELMLNPDGSLESID